MKDYLEILYSRDNKPLTNYPEKLVQFILDKSGIKDCSGMKLLEPGVGLGDHLRILKKKGFAVFGLDVSPMSLSESPDLSIKIVDESTKIWPYEDESMDIIYSKSFIEHLADPGIFLSESLRVLRSGGKIITLTPDWESNVKKFYDDYTHKSPYTTVSLKNILLSYGFTHVDVFKFRQLPFTWKSPFLNSISALIGLFVHHRAQAKFLRWSRELMIFSVATKP